MADSNFMNILNSGNNLLEESASFILIQAFPFYDVIKQLSSACIFHDEE